MKFNNYDFTEEFNILAIRRNILPPLSTNAIKLPNKQGVLIANSTKESRVEADFIEVDIEIMSATKSAKRAKVRSIASKLLTSNVAKLELPDEPDMYDMAILTEESSLTELYTIGSATLRFMRPEPISFGATKTDVNANTAVNTGTYETSGIIKVTNTASATSLTILLDGTNRLIMNDTFSIGTQIEIDLEKEVIRKNGLIFMDKLTLASRFFKLPTGQLKITASPSAWSQPTVTFTERWL